jgi:uncharacterized protein
MEQLSRHPIRLGLTTADLRRLSQGPADAELMDTLRRAQLSRTLLLVKHLVDQDDPGLGEAAALLATAGDADPGTVRDLVLHPWLAVWAAQRVRAGADASRPDCLGGTALAAAARTGLTGAELAVPACGGILAAPGFGVRPAPARGARVRAGDLTGPPWVPPRRYALRHNGLTLALTVDDLDPYRDCYGVPVAGRLDEPAAASLAASLAGAWRLLADHLPGYAAELARGLRVFVPLGDAGEGSHSVTHADGFGAFAAEPNLGEVEFAVAMVHEFQHSKLSVAMHLLDLFDPDDRGRYHSPWRRDPRPVGALLHGVYAFTAVAELWSALRGHPLLGEQAARRCAEVRAQVARALRELDRVDSLTPAGCELRECLAERNAEGFAATGRGAVVDGAPRATPG